MHEKSFIASGPGFGLELSILQVNKCMFRESNSDILLFASFLNGGQLLEEFLPLKLAGMSWV